MRSKNVLIGIWHFHKTAPNTPLLPLHNTAALAQPVHHPTARHTQANGSVDPAKRSVTDVRCNMRKEIRILVGAGNYFLYLSAIPTLRFAQKISHLSSCLYILFNAGLCTRFARLALYRASRIASAAQCNCKEDILWRGLNPIL